MWIGSLAEAQSTVDQVKFSLDGRLLSIENGAPFDLFRTKWTGASLPFDTTLLADGPHTVSASIRLYSGQVITRTATFTVSNGTNAKRLEYSLRSNRSNSQILQGASIVGSPVFVSFVPNNSIENADVQFELDGSVVWTERAAPYDLGGTQRNGNAAGFTVSRGQHTLEAVVLLPKNVTMSIEASFARR